MILFYVLLVDIPSSSRFKQMKLGERDIRMKHIIGTMSIILLMGGLIITGCTEKEKRTASYGADAGFSFLSTNKNC